MRALTLLALVLVAAGCGASSTTAGEERMAQERPPGRLVVWEDRPDQPVHTEGSVGYLQIVDDAGAVLFERRISTLRERVRPGFDRRLPAGVYRIASWQRPCSANCGRLDPPADRCVRRVRVRAGQRTTARAILGQSGGCRVVATQSG